MEETYFPDDIWGEIKLFLLPPPLPKYPHPLSILINDLSTIYTMDNPKEKILYGYCMSCGTQTGWYFVKLIHLINVITMIVHLYVINAESLKKN